MPRHAPRLSALAAAMLLSALPCAPGAAADQAAIPTVTVALAEQRGLFEHGRSAVYRGVADEQGVAFVIPALTINTAAALVLQAGETGAPMRLQLKNDFSEDWDRSLDTGREGALLTRFRTEGPAVALVSSVAGGPQPYRLVVWVGSEIKPHTAAAPPFVSPGQYDGERGGWRWLVAAVAVLGLLAAGATWLRRRRQLRSRALRQRRLEHPLRLHVPAGDPHRVRARGRRLAAARPTRPGTPGRACAGCRRRRPVRPARPPEG